MAYGIPATEFLGILLMMADYDPEMNALQVVERFEEYQKITGLTFGDYPEELHGAFANLVWKIKPQIKWDKLDDELENTRLRDWIEPILRYHFIYCNDESEHWFEQPEDDDWPEEKRRLVSWRSPDGELHERSYRDFLEDRFTIKASLRFDRRMRELFKDGVPDRLEIIRFFRRSLYSRQIPYYWAKSGL
jgi:hypothetical protein